MIGEKEFKARGYGKKYEAGPTIGRKVLVGYDAQGKPMAIDAAQVVIGLGSKDMQALTDEALRLFPKPKGTRRLMKASAITADIVKAVIKEIVTSRHQAAAFAQHILARQASTHGSFRSDYIEAQEVWAWIKGAVKYREDGAGEQLIKTPSAVVHEREADCKGLTILFSSILFQLGIPHVVRFSGKEEKGEFTHVYVALEVRGPKGEKALVPWDLCMAADKVGTDPAGHVRFKDYNTKDMTAIYRIAGDGGILSLPDDIGAMTETELELHIAKAQRMAKAERAVAVAGVGRLSNSYMAEIAAIDDMIDAARERDEARLDEIGNHIDRGLYGIGRDKERKARAGSGGRPATRPTRGLVRKVAQGIKKGAQAVAKGATAPQRLAVKGILEATLPKASPYFLYLFVNDPGLIAKLPDAARSKRKSAEKIADFIVKTIGMKRDHFMGILRAGIIKNLGKDPEKVIADQLGGKVSGIGVVTDVIGIVLDLIQKIAKAFGKKAPEIAKGSEPKGSDLAGLQGQAARELAQKVAAQPKADGGDVFDPAPVPTTRGWCK